jgi:hypothetical protein
MSLESVGQVCSVASQEAQCEHSASSSGGGGGSRSGGGGASVLHLPREVVLSRIWPHPLPARLPARQGAGGGVSRSRESSVGVHAGDDGDFCGTQFTCLTCTY